MNPEHKKALGVMPPLTGNIYFSDLDFDGQLLRTMGKTFEGGADIGEVFSTAFRIEEGDFESWYQEWQRIASRVEGAAEISLSHGHPVSAREAFLRACEYYRSAEFFLREDLDDPRISESADSIRRCFKKAGSLFSPPAWAIEIPFESTVLNGYFFKADDSAKPRPTIILNGGYDGYVEELFFLGGGAALKRGYNVLAFDGPGQGHVLRRQRLYFRPDWEQVIGPVIDYALKIEEIDPKHIILMGRSLGGYLATRAATAEGRLAALVVDPGQHDFGGLLQAQLPSQILELMAAGKSTEVDAIFMDLFRKDQSRRFFFQSRMETHGATSPSDYLSLMDGYSAKGLVHKIKCPTAVCLPSDDPGRAGQAKELYDLLESPKVLISFAAEEGAGDHCEVGAPSLFAQRVFDWLDAIIH